MDFSAMEDLETAVECVPRPGRGRARGTAASEGGGGAAYQESCKVRALSSRPNHAWLSASSRFYNTPLTTPPAELLSLYTGIDTLFQANGPYAFNAVDLGLGSHTLNAKYAGNARSVG